MTDIHPTTSQFCGFSCFQKEQQSRARGPEQRSGTPASARSLGSTLARLSDSSGGPRTTPARRFTLEGRVTTGNFSPHPLHFLPSSPSFSFLSSFFPTPYRLFLLQVCRRNNSEATAKRTETAGRSLNVQGPPGLKPEPTGAQAQPQAPWAMAPTAPQSPSHIRSPSS